MRATVYCVGWEPALSWLVVDPSRIAWLVDLRRASGLHITAEQRRQRAGAQPFASVDGGVGAPLHGVERGGCCERAPGAEPRPAGSDGLGRYCQVGRWMDGALHPLCVVRRVVSYVVALELWACRRP